MDSSMRLITAVLLFVTIFHRSEVAAQSPTPKMANECYAVCEGSWSALLRNTSSPRKFLAQYENSTQIASDYYCSTTANISACFSACAQRYSAFAYRDPLYILGTLASEAFSCFADESKCRAKDSKLWCNAYYATSCGSTKKRDECIASVQAKRGCDFSNPTHQSQRTVMSIVLDDVLYCLNDFDTSKISQFDGGQVQICVQYVSTICLATLTDPQTGRNLPYYLGNVTCNNIQDARDCVQALLTQSIDFSGQRYSMPCKYHPSGVALFEKIDIVLRNLLPCLPSTTANNSTATAVTTAPSATTETGSQSTSGISAVKECNNACDSQYTSVDTTALQTTSITTFLLNRGNNTKRAADEACRLLADVETCYQTCDSRFPSNPSSTVSSKASDARGLNVQFCLTPNDGTYCRLMDSYYCEAIYNKRNCGEALKNFMSCVVDTQLRSNNCSLNDAATWSQRNVHWYMATAVQYCAVSTEAVGDLLMSLTDRAEAAKLQVCRSITKVCFGDFTSSGTQFSFADRYLVTESCSVFQKAELCLWRTLNGTVLYNGQNVYATCSSLPDKVAAITSLVNVLRSLTPKKCLPLTSTTGPSRISASANVQQTLSDAGVTFMITTPGGPRRISESPQPAFTSDSQITTPGGPRRISESPQPAFTSESQSDLLFTTGQPSNSPTQQTSTTMSLKSTTSSTGHVKLPCKAPVFIITIIIAFVDKFALPSA